MFLPFKISAESLTCLGYDKNMKYCHAEANSKDHLDQLRSYLSSTEGVIDGDCLAKLWFPNDSYHVFISHSHSDLNMAHFLAKWLETNCKLKCFIDADVWENAFDLLKELDKSHCDNWKADDIWFYDYAQHNLCAAHVYSMLSIALMEAIDNIVCPIFIETDNSVPLKDAVQDKTLSPWIFEEVSFMNKLERKTPCWMADTKYFSTKEKSILLEKAQDSLKISHTIPTKGLVKINSTNIRTMRGKEKLHALKALYFSIFSICNSVYQG